MAGENYCSTFKGAELKKHGRRLCAVLDWYPLGVKKFQATPTKQDLGTSLGFFQTSRQAPLSFLYGSLLGESRVTTLEGLAKICALDYVVHQGNRGKFVWKPASRKYILLVERYMTTSFDVPLGLSTGNIEGFQYTKLTDSLGASH